MGLDRVELVLRTEETFAIDIPTEQASTIETVGDLYRAVLHKLQLPYVSAAEAESQPYRVFLAPAAHLGPWTTPDVWANLKAIIVDQLQVDDSEVQESARFQQDLHCD